MILAFSNYFQLRLIGLVFKPIKPLVSTKGKMFDFETWVDRCGHDSMSADRLKNDLWQLPLGNPKPEFDAIPLWLADMNFATAPCVIEAIKKRLEHPIFGYFAPSAEYYEAIKKWQKDSFGVTDLSE